MFRVQTESGGNCINWPTSPSVLRENWKLKRVKGKGYSLVNTFRIQSFAAYQCVRGTATTDPTAQLCILPGPVVQTNIFRFKIVSVSRHSAKGTTHPRERSLYSTIITSGQCTNMNRLWILESPSEIEHFDITSSCCESVCMRPSYTRLKIKIKFYIWVNLGKFVCMSVHVNCKNCT